MTPEPEDTNPPDSGAPTDQPFANTTAAEPTEPPTNEGDRYIDTEAWIDQWWQEVLAQGDQPSVVDLETGEPTPVAFPNLPAKEAECPRCGHREVVDPTVLLPPFCPACGNAMDWLSAPDPPPTNPPTSDLPTSALPNDQPANPLLDTIERISDLSSKLAADSEGGGRQ